MNQTLVTALVFALLLAIVALVREVRLRRALQELLRRLFNCWRSTTREELPRGNADQSGSNRTERM